MVLHVTQVPRFPTVDVSASPLLPPLTIVDESEDGKFYKIEVTSPKGPVFVTVKSDSFTPLQNGQLTVQKADAIDILE
jgi:hypothetical protein